MFTPISNLRYLDFEINLAAGLEDSLIAAFAPPWNGREKGKLVSEDAEREQVEEAADTRPAGSERAIEQIGPTPAPALAAFEITLGQAYYHQGLINPGVDASKHLGADGEPIQVLFDWRRAGFVSDKPDGQRFWERPCRWAKSSNRRLAPEPLPSRRRCARPGPWPEPHSSIVSPFLARAVPLSSAAQRRAKPKRTFGFAPISVRPFGQVYKAASAITAAIDGLAALLTGDRDYSWDNGSTGSSGGPRQPDRQTASAAEGAARRMSYTHPGAVASLEGAIWRRKVCGCRNAPLVRGRSGRGCLSQQSKARALPQEFVEVRKRSELRKQG